MTVTKETSDVQPAAEESLIDMANKLVETADQLLTAAYVMATLVEEELPQGSILRNLLNFGGPNPVIHDWATRPVTHPPVSRPYQKKKVMFPFKHVYDRIEGRVLPPVKIMTRYTRHGSLVMIY